MAETYQIDANGIPIKPGYRKPFNSETGREAGLKGARATALAWDNLKRENQIAHEVLRQVQSLLKSPKRGSRVVLQKSGRGKTVVKNPSDSTVNPSPTVRPISRPPSSAVSPAAPVSPTVKPAPATAKPAPAQYDDCLF